MVTHSSLPAFAVSQPIIFGKSRAHVTRMKAICCAEGNRTTVKKRARKRPQNQNPGGRIISDVLVGEEFIGKIAEVGPANSSWVDIGVFTKRGRPIHARLPFKNDSSSSTNVEGAVVPVYVRKVNHGAGRIEVRKGVRPRPKEATSEVSIMLNTLRVGDKLQGTVVGLGRYGAVLDANIYRLGKHGQMTRCPGLLQRKNFREEWYSAADQVIKSDAKRYIAIGDTLDVTVRAAHVQNAFLLFDGYDVRPEDVVEAKRQHRLATRRRNRRAPIDSLQVGDIRDGVVAHIAQFGVFVDIGVKSNGLIHYTEMGERHRGEWKEVVGINSRVTAEVLRVDGTRISLRLISLKEESLREALEVANSAVARTEDIELAAALQLANKRDTRNLVPALDDSDLSRTSNQAPVAKTIPSEFDGEAEVDEDDTGKEEQEKFSDEYFEDKYGF